METAVDEVGKGWKTRGFANGPEILHTGRITECLLLHGFSIDSPQPLSATKTSLKRLNGASNVDISLNMGANFLASVLNSGVITTTKHPPNFGKGMLGM